MTEILTHSRAAQALLANITSAAHRYTPPVPNTALKLLDLSATALGVAIGMLENAGGEPPRRPLHRCSATAAGTGEDGAPCDRPMYHEGPHSWDLTSMTAPATYAIPGPPPVDREVTNGTDRWRRKADGLYVPLRAPEFTEEITGYGREWEWPDLLEAHGPLHLVPLTREQEHAATLYGPPGARWGQIGDPCPRFECNLWRGHVGEHQDSTGKAIAAAELAADDIPAGPGGGLAAITPQEAAQTPCTCGDPAAHRPGCARYDRTGAGIRRFALTNYHGHVILFAAVSGTDDDAIVRTDRFGQMGGPLPMVHSYLVGVLGDAYEALTAGYTASTAFEEYREHPEATGAVTYQFDIDGHPAVMTVEPNGLGQYSITATGLTPFLVFELGTAYDRMVEEYRAEVTA